MAETGEFVRENEVPISSYFSKLQDCNEPLFCKAIVEIMKIDHQKIPSNSNETALIDVNTLTFIRPSLQSEIDSCLNFRELDLNTQVANLLPLCKRLAIECHSAVKSRNMEDLMSLKMSQLHESVWSSSKMFWLCSEDAVERIFGLISVTARLEWIISCLVCRRLQLKDNLQSEEVKDILGRDLVQILQCILGCVKGFNLKNLTWHGFVSSSNIPPELFSLLFCSVLTVSSRLSKHNFQTRDSLKVPLLQNLPPAPEIPLSTCQNIVKNSLLVHEDQLEMWLTLLHHSAHLWNSSAVPTSDHITMVTSVNIVLLQQSLRKLWVVTSESDPTRCSAQNTEFYITLDEVFSPSCISDDPRPAASYFSSTYSKCQTDLSSENALVPVLGSGIFHALLDLFVHGDGLRLRDKLSHCECDCVDVSVSYHLFYLSMSILARFCDPRIQNSCSDLISFYDSYQHRFHPFCMMIEVVKNVETISEKLTKFGEEVDKSGIDERKTDFIQKLHDLLKTTNRYCVAKPSVSLFVGPAKTKYFSLILEILKNVEKFSSELLEIAKIKFELYKDRKLRSRQRQNFSTLITALPCFTKCIGLSRTFLYTSVNHVENLTMYDFEENKCFVKFLKGSLKCYENLVAIVGLSKWVEIGGFLVNFLDDWNNLFSEGVHCA